MNIKFFGITAFLSLLPSVAMAQMFTWTELPDAAGYGQRQALVNGQGQVVYTKRINSQLRTALYNHATQSAPVVINDPNNSQNIRLAALTDHGSGTTYVLAQSDTGRVLQANLTGSGTPTFATSSLFAQNAVDIDLHGDSLIQYGSPYPNNRVAAILPAQIFFDVSDFPRNVILKGMSIYHTIIGVSQDGRPLVRRAGASSFTYLSANQGTLSDISNDGHIAGSIRTGFIYNGLRVTNTGTVSLINSLSGDTSSVLIAINDNGLAGGASYQESNPDGTSKATYLRPGATALVNLNSRLIKPLNGGDSLTQVISVANSSAGYMLALGAYDPDTRKLYMLSCAGDFNRNGIINSEDSTLFHNLYFAGDSSTDINGDGEVNPDDLADYTGAFYEGCMSRLF